MNSPPILAWLKLRDYLLVERLPYLADALEEAGDARADTLRRWITLSPDSTFLADPFLLPEERRERDRDIPTRYELPQRVRELLLRGSVRCRVYHGLGRVPDGRQYNDCPNCDSHGWIPPQSPADEEA